MRILKLVGVTFGGIVFGIPGVLFGAFSIAGFILWLMGEISWCIEILEFAGIGVLGIACCVLAFGYLRKELNRGKNK
jgi:hypothetical protein